MGYERAGWNCFNRAGIFGKNIPDVSGFFSDKKELPGPVFGNHLLKP